MYLASALGFGFSLVSLWSQREAIYVSSALGFGFSLVSKRSHLCVLFAGRNAY